MNRRTKTFILFPARDVDESLRFTPLPQELAGWGRLDISVARSVLKDLLEVVEARPDDEFAVRVVDAIDRQYHSEPERAATYLSGPGLPHLVVHHKPPFTIAEIGEEEYFPEGISIEDIKITPPRGGASQA